MTFGCEEARRHVDAWIDGELDVSAAVEIDTHVSHCALCRDEADGIRVLKKSLGGLREQDFAPASLRTKLSAMLVEEDAAQARAHAVVQKRRNAAGFMLAGAALAGFVVATGRHDADPSARTQNASLAFGSEVFDDIARRHARELPAEVHASQPAEVANFFRGRMDFPVRPITFRGVPAQLVGGRISHVRAQSAAALYYDLSGRRVTVFVFDGSAIPVDTLGAARAMVGARPVYVGNARGYTVAVSVRNGLGYAVATDLPPDDAMRIVANAEVTP